MVGKIMSLQIICMSNESYQFVNRKLRYGLLWFVVWNNQILRDGP